jgi:flagellar motor switch protein FliN/FliY
MTSEESRNIGSAVNATAVEESEGVTSAEQTDDVDAPVEATAAADGNNEAVKKAEFQPVSESKSHGAPAGMNLLLDVTLPVSIELGRTVMCVKEILSVCEGSVIELDRLAGEPVDITVGGRLLGKGEVVVMNERFGVRITELVNPIEGVAKA